MPKIGETDILTDLRVAADLDTERLNHRHLRPDQFARQAIAWNAGVEHAGRLRFHLKDRGPKPHEGKVVPGSKPSRPRTDDRDSLSGGLWKLGIREKLEQLTEFLDVVALARFVLAPQVGK